MLNAAETDRPNLMTHADASDVKSLYLEALSQIERLHRRLLDVIKDELDKSGRSEITSVQALLIFNIGESELSAGELRKRGYYLGSNVSYNLKRLVEGSYIRYERSPVDGRSVHISLTGRGREVAKIVSVFYDRHVSIQEVGGINAEEFKQLNQSLGKLGRFWTAQLHYER